MKDSVDVEKFLNLFPGENGYMVKIATCSPSWPQRADSHKTREKTSHAAESLKR